MSPQRQTESFNTLVHNKWHRKVTEAGWAQVISSPQFTLSQRKLFRAQHISPEELKRWCNDMSVWTNSSFQMEEKPNYKKKKKKPEWWHTLPSFNFQTIKSIWMNSELVSETDLQNISCIAHGLHTSKLKLHTFLHFNLISCLSLNDEGLFPPTHL